MLESPPYSLKNRSLDPPNIGVQAYDVSVDGEQFLMVKQDEAGAGELTIVLNWFEELKPRVPSP